MCRQSSDQPHVDQSIDGHSDVEMSATGSLDPGQSAVDPSEELSMTRLPVDT